MEIFINIKKECRLRYDEILLSMVVSLGGGLLGLLIGCIVRANTTENPTGMAALISIIFSCTWIIFTHVFSLPYHFEIMISMGRTRKEFVKNNLIFCWGNTLIMWLMYCIVYYIEKGIFRNLDLDLGIITNPLLAVFFIFMIVSVTFFCGALIIKFGVKAMWGLWAAWMILCLSPNALIHRMTNHPELSMWIHRVITIITNMGAGLWIVAGILFSILL